MHQESTPKGGERISPYPDPREGRGAMKRIRKFMQAFVFVLLLSMTVMSGALALGIIEVAEPPPIPIVIAIFIMGIIALALMYSNYSGVFYENIMKMGTGIRGAPSILMSGTNSSATDVSPVIIDNGVRSKGRPTIGAAPALAA